MLRRNNLSKPPKILSRSIALDNNSDTNSRQMSTPRSKTSAKKSASFFLRKTVKQSVAKGGEYDSVSLAGMTKKQVLK